MPPIDYIFIDWENVSEFEPARIVGKRARVFMILGAMQAYLPVSLVLFLQSHPEQLKIIQSSVVGRNALDFVLSCELGRALAADPDGSFHIVSKDKDFKSIVTHLQGSGRLIARHRSIAEIPSLLTAEERVASLRAALENPAAERPVTRHGLEETIRARFLHQADDILVGRVVAYLIAENVLRITAADYVVYPAG